MRQSKESRDRGLQLSCMRWGNWDKLQGNDESDVKQLAEIAEEATVRKSQQSLSP